MHCWLHNHRSNSVDKSVVRTFNLKMDFVIDTGGSNSSEKPVEPQPNPKATLVAKLLEEYREDRVSTTDVSCVNNKKKEANHLEDFFKEMGWDSPTSKKPKSNVTAELNKLKEDTEEVLKKSVITTDFLKKQTGVTYDLSEKALKKIRKKEAEKTKGKKWYGLPATELTEEVKRDLEVLQMRSVLDPKRFYKKNDLKVLPKYFQIGKVMDSPLDHYNRITKQDRKRTLVDELLADAEFTKYNKRKYKEIVQERQKTHYKAWRQAKKLKKKK